MGRAETEILEILCDGAPVSQSDLVRATGFSRSTMSEALASLERRKMVRRSKEGRNSKVAYIAGRRRSGKRLRLGFTRSAEYPFLVPLRRLLRDDGLDLEFRVYENGTAVARDLSLMRIDVGIAPLITLFVLHALDAPFKMIGPAGAGGSSVMASPRRTAGGHRGMSAVCTKVSTMEMLIRSAENLHAIPGIETLAYASSPSEIERALMSGAADMCSIWEPYATIMETKGAKRVVRYSELADHVCCAAAAGNHLGDRRLASLSKRYTESLDALRRGGDSYSASYAALAGLQASTLRRVGAEYSYPRELSSNQVARQFQAAGLTLPSPSSFADSVFKGSA